MRIHKVSFSLYLCLLALASGFSCTATNKPKQTVTDSPPAELVTPYPASPRLSTADKFVQRAEALFEQGKLIAPLEQNAYTLFRAAQIMEPDHAGANAGLNAILIAEISKARTQLGSGKSKQAKLSVQELGRLYVDNPLIKQLSDEISEVEKAKQKKAASKAKAKKAQVDPKRIFLDEVALKERSEDIIAHLKELAITVSKSKEGVLIYANSDAQARWIYQQMRQAVPDYRIRGDLRIGKPSIKLLAPFE